MGGKPRPRKKPTTMHVRTIDIALGRMAVQGYLDGNGGAESGWLFDHAEERLAQTIAATITKARIECVKPTPVYAPAPILKCPFCTGQGLLGQVPCDPAQPDVVAHYVRCRSCAAQGPRMKSASSAVRMWNLRPQPVTRGT